MCWSLFCGISGGLKKLDRFRFRPKENFTDKRGGYQGSVVSFTKEKEKKEHAAFVFSASSLPTFSSSPPILLLHLHSPCYSTHRRVYCCIIPSGLIVVFLCFVCLPACLVRCVRYLLRHLRSFWVPGLLIQEVDCYMCDIIGAVGLLSSFQLWLSPGKNAAAGDRYRPVLAVSMTAAGVGHHSLPLGATGLFKCRCCIMVLCPRG